MIGRPFATSRLTWNRLVLRFEGDTRSPSIHLTTGVKQPGMGGTHPVGFRAICTEQMLHGGAQIRNDKQILRVNYIKTRPAAVIS